MNQLIFNFQLEKYVFCIKNKKREKKKNRKFNLNHI